jgi:hypothetical protein
MKRISYFLSAILACLFLACGDDKKVTGEPDPIEPDEPVVENPVSIEIQGEATLSPFVTRATTDGTTVSWSDYDTFRLYNEVEKAVSDTKMSFGKTNGATTATFTGMAAFVEGARAFYGVYPYTLGSITVSDYTKYPISIAGDQTAAAAADYLIALAYKSFTGNPDADHPLDLQFKTITSQWRVNLQNDDEYNVKGVQIVVDPNGATPSAEPFITSGTIDIKKDYATTAVTVLPVTRGTSLGTTFAASSTDAAQTATLYLLPTTVAGDLKVIVTLDDNSSLTIPVADFNQEFTAGTFYTYDVNLEDAEELIEPPEPDDPDFEIVDGVLMAYYGAGGDITIPSKATSTRSGAIGTNDGVFVGKNTITSVNLNQVVTLGANTFKSNTGIIHVDAPNLEVIEDEGFHNCPNLVDITGSKIRSLGAHTFQSCTNLKTVDVSKVTELTGANGGQRVFRLCPNIEFIDMSSFEGSIPFQAFIGCAKLETILLPKATAIGGTDGATSNRGQVFADNPVIKTLNLPEVTVLSWRSINALITTLNAPKVTTLRQQALGYMSELRYVAFPALTTIEANMFQANSVTKMIVDLSEATGLVNVAAGAIATTTDTSTSDIQIYVATQAIKDLFTPVPNYVQIIVGAPPVIP